MGYMAKIFPSSQNPEETMLRVKSFLVLAVPIILNALNMLMGQTLAPEAVLSFVDATFVILFGVLQTIGWLRSLKDNSLPTETRNTIID
jgi:hypothetical protein